MPPAMSSPVLRRVPDEASTAASRPAADARARWHDAFRTVRAETECRAAPLSAEDQVIQSMPDASPTKWHRAHATWFFEQFLLVPHLIGYRVFDERFAFLFNSYYVAAGPRHARLRRGLITQPDCAAVAAYRTHVDAAVERLIADVDDARLAEVVRVLEIGMHHEQQHQELLLTDILHAFAQNPIAPAYDAAWRPPSARSVAEEAYVDLPPGLHRIGFAGEGYCFDNEQPAHQVYLQPARISRGLVSNGRWLEFMAEGGYATPSLWLSDGWAVVESEGWTAPGYWRRHDGAWHAVTLGGLATVDPDAPVMHLSYYEADAFARWAGKHLPTEAEWEVAARQSLNGQALIDDAFGVVWQWTRSAYLPYPGYRAADGALGEYNGKFMVNQMVLRGSSLATPDGHARVSYRNFFHPPARWQFSGLRLVDYVG
jgi:ergothioneine biosynthesis protein EgtB